MVKQNSLKISDANALIGCNTLNKNDVKSLIQGVFTDQVKLGMDSTQSRQVREDETRHQLSKNGNLTQQVCTSGNWI